MSSQPLRRRGSRTRAANASFSALNALQRLACVTDPGWCELIAGASTPVLVARGRIAGKTVLLGLTDGSMKGGTLGVREARTLGRLGHLAERERPDGIVLVWDTGGVRVQEGPAALAAASAVGVSLCRQALLGTPVVHVVSPPRGCFGAPSVIARTSRMLLLVEGSLWGLNGPRLLEGPAGSADPQEARAAVSASWRAGAGQADALVSDRTPRVTEAIAAALMSPVARSTPADVVREAARVVHALSPGIPDAAPSRRRRDLFTYSFRGNWRLTGPEIREGLVHAAWGELRGEPALGIIVGPDPRGRGLSIEDAKGIAEALASAADRPGRTPPPIVTFVFCRGHENRIEEERSGLPVALAQCLRAYVAARLRGHPLVCVLGGGAYGAAYLSIAAPSHRVLAIRGTTVAPMAPRVLAAFQKMRGVRTAEETPRNLATLLPEIEIVENVVRLPRAVLQALDSARKEGPWPTSQLAARS